MDNKGKNGNTESKRKGYVSPMRYPQLFLVHALIVIIIVWLIFGVFIGLLTAPNDDMSPRISGGDLLIYYRLDKDVKAGDVVVLNKDDTNYVARVVAVGGDTVDITDDQRLVINGNYVVENNIFYKTVKYDEQYMTYPYTVEENRYFVLVDRRESGEDSRFYGTVYSEEIKGTVLTVIRSHNL